MKQESFLRGFIIFILLVLAGCASISPELQKIADRAKEAEEGSAQTRKYVYAELNEYFGRNYIGLTKQGARELFGGEPQQVKPDEGVGFEEWDYSFRKSKVLSKERGAWTTVKQVKSYFLKLAFPADEKVKGATISDPERTVEGKGVLNKAVPCLGMLVDLSISINPTPEMVKIAGMLERGQIEELNKHLEEDYPGLTEQEVRILFGNPRLTNPNLLTGSDVLYYFVKAPESLGKERGIWTTTEKLKLHLLVIRFQDGRVTTAFIPEPKEESMDKAGVAKKMVPCAISIGTMVF